MPQFNAIRVSDKIEKTFIDFSSYKSLKESSGFKRLYTIHTAETNKIADLLGFHVGGFCDDYGNNTNLLAGKISGYGTLPSDLILCLMNDKYGFLPLSEEQLNYLYTYLTTGKVTNLVVEDTIEEAQEDSGDAINDFIIFEVDAKWPNDPERFAFSGQYIIPFNPPSGLKPSIPWFEQFFEIIGLDEINEKITIKIHEGEEEKTMDLPLNEKVIYDFNYYRDRSIEKSLRVGRASFKYIKPYLTIDPIPGRIKVNTKYEIDGKLENDDNGYFEKIDYDEEVSGYVDNVLGDRFYILYTAIDDNLVILYGFSPDPDNDNENITTYYPLYLNNASGNKTSYFDSEKKQTIMYSVTFTYEETSEDENDDECILKIHQSYSYRDTYDEYEDDSDYELEVKDGNSIELKGCKFLIIKRINEKYHNATVYIGNSTNLENCQSYVVDLKGRTANYKYSFNGGCNDNYHAESNIIEARLEKKWVRLD